MNSFFLKNFLLLFLNFVVKFDCFSNVIIIQNQSSRPIELKLFKFNGNRLLLVDFAVSLKNNTKYKVIDSSNIVENYYLQFDSVVLRFMYLNEIEIYININDIGNTISTPLNSILSYHDEGKLLQNYFENRIVNSKDTFKLQAINDVMFVLLNPNKSDSAALIKAINLFYCNFNEPEIRSFLLKDSENAIPYFVNNCNNVASLKALYLYLLELFHESHKVTCKIYCLISLDHRAVWLSKEEKNTFGNLYSKYCKDH